MIPVAVEFQKIFKDPARVSWFVRETDTKSRGILVIALTEHSRFLLTFVLLPEMTKKVFQNLQFIRTKNYKYKTSQG